MVNAKQYEENIQKELARIQKLHAENPLQYHNEVLLQDGGVENPLRHIGRVKLSPRNGRQKKIIGIASGNNEPLTQPWDRYASYRGTMYMFDQITKMNMQDTDILQLKTGEAPLLASVPEEFHTRIVLAHIRNIMNDLVAGIGIFAGRTYERARLYGFSYGAGMWDLVLQDFEKRSKNGESIPRIDRTVYLDGIQHGTMGTPLTRRSGLSGQHYQLHQRQGFVLTGRPLDSDKKQKQDFEMEMKQDSLDTVAQQKVKIDHRTLHDARYNRATLDGIVAALTHG